VTIQNYLDEKLVLYIHAKDRDAAIAELVYAAGKSGKVSDPVAYEKAVLHRENIVSTGVGMGVAIPHAKMRSCDDFFIVVGIQRGKGLDWKALDEGVVKLIFLIGGPPDKQTEYLQILSRLTSCIKDNDFRKKIIASKLPRNVIAIINEQASAK
jgi:nitrogen PTS system EIIA component